ncbi:hypothetical protein FVE85_0316 [Porphyridium purpureum]|uniref:GDT1 family protein n=1 Tax=Porphyridium purpureum TaxID=35688 RepID=A0A5J4Z1N5_PORPP|nr:hypothetical protein FVE85_0316 [Porphyridium purpureum]|eukprot:POR1646..scf208_2
MVRLTELAVLVAVSGVHLSMPNHWAQFVIVGKAQKWSMATILMLTVLGALGHVLGTVIAAVLMAALGDAFVPKSLHKYLPTAVLFIFGAYYVASHFRLMPDPCACEHDAEEAGRLQPDRHTLCSNHNHTGSSLADEQGASGEDTKFVQACEEENEQSDAAYAKQQRFMQVSVVLLPTFSPCVGSSPILISSIARAIDGQPDAVLDSMFYVLAMVIAAVCTMVALVFFTVIGTSRMNFAFVQRNEKLIIGGSLILLSLLPLLLRHGHDHVDD